MSQWKPDEIIVHEKVRNDPVATFIIQQCPESRVNFVQSGLPKHIIAASEILSSTGNSMVEKIMAGKKVVYIAPASNVVDVFSMPDDRIVCPEFDRLKLASNGCFYQCDWCYLKLTYRAAFPFITIRCEYEKIKERVLRHLRRSSEPVIFNSGELVDSLSMEHLTRAGQVFIPWFGNTENGYLYMLTKSDNVDALLGLEHNGRTIITWSMNNKTVSRKYEIGAPTFERRLEASRKVQQAGYPVRIRLDPIVPIDGWREEYAETIHQIFTVISPERVTLGTLRFEEGFYNKRNSIFTSGPDLRQFLETMMPMFPPRMVPGLKKPRTGKYSFSEEQRVEIFRFAIGEIRKRSDCPIALCKESANVWNQTGLQISSRSCVCQLDYTNVEVLAMFDY